MISILFVPLVIAILDIVTYSGKLGTYSGDGCDVGSDVGSDDGCDDGSDVGFDDGCDVGLV